ncbi:MAG: PQQ-binding-like beta-propeller repeat protein [Actinobacteria bacterium]|nr:PQQ-binding-like beta-propeller repeat protein [Actinomycetota bacterium]
MRARVVMVVVPLLAALVPMATVSPPVQAGQVSGGNRSLVFNGQGNDLGVYDSASGAKQTLIHNVGADPETGRDINAQICFTEIGGVRYFIAGEDSGQDTPEGSPGWGWFALTGDEVGELGWTQLGKLRPTWSGGDQAENYGCGFLPDGRLITTDVGDQLPHQPASGQLIEWFPNSDATFADATTPGGDWHNVDNRLDTNYCKIDTSIGTAGGTWVDGGWVYAAANRPGPSGPGGIYRYEIADFPTDSTCAGLGNQADLVDEGVVTRELWLASDPFVLTPSAAIPSGREWNTFPTWYVSSVFTGVIAEYADTGTARVHVRNVMEPPAGAPLGQLDDFAEESGLPVNDGGTPYGLGLTASGDLWYADLGIQGDGPADGHGSVQRITLDSQGNAQRLIVDDGLDYPDGIGVLDFPVTRELARGSFPDATDRHATSDSRCDAWRMYGRDASRAFSTPDGCSAIDTTNAATLVPRWTFKTEKTVTASPAVSNGRVFVGDWSAHMYALDADDGSLVWKEGPFTSPGAAFGPIVSSAAVAEVRIDRHREELVIFGAGPRLIALRADDGSVVWSREVDYAGTDADLPAGTPVEVESSPVVWKGVVYVGMDNHNTGGTGVRGGLLAVDAATGDLLWKFEPEDPARAGDPATDAGCGGVWSSPTVSTHDRLVYLATANCPDGDFEWTPNTEAITALDAGTGEVKWSFQPHTANHKDWDFGATPNLFEAGGRRVLGAGSKDGWYYALDARTGALQWKTKAADGGDVNENFAIGGFIGSTAAHKGNVYGGTAIGGPPYYHSFDGATGEVRWRGAQAPSYAASAAVRGVVFSGALDNLLKAYDTATGAVVWSSPLFGPISSGPAIVGNSVYVGSGTSSSDACAKEFGEEINDFCQQAFDEVVGSTGGIHAFGLATSALP